MCRNMQGLKVRKKGSSSRMKTVCYLNLVPKFRRATNYDYSVFRLICDRGK